MLAGATAWHQQVLAGASSKPRTLQHSCRKLQTQTHVATKAGQYGGPEATLARHSWHTDGRLDRWACWAMAPQHYRQRPLAAQSVCGQNVCTSTGLGRHKTTECDSPRISTVTVDYIYRYLQGIDANKQCTHHQPSTHCPAGRTTDTGQMSPARLINTTITGRALLQDDTEYQAWHVHHWCQQLTVSIATCHRAQAMHVCVFSHDPPPTYTIQAGSAAQHDVADERCRSTRPRQAIATHMTEPNATRTGEMYSNKAVPLHEPYWGSCTT